MDKLNLVLLNQAFCAALHLPKVEQGGEHRRFCGVGQRVPVNVRLAEQGEDALFVLSVALGFFERN